MTLRVSKNQKRAVYGEKRLVFVPYEIYARQPVIPRGYNDWCAACALKQDGCMACAMSMGETQCRIDYRSKYRVHGYWKEVTE